MPYRLIDQTRNPRLRTFLHVIGAVATSVLVIGVLVLVVQIWELTSLTRQTQLNNSQRTEDTRTAAVEARRAAESAERSAARIEDCTTPGRECFADSQKRLGRTVGTINSFALAAAACADSPRAQTIDEIEDCILEEISSHRQPQR